MCIVSSRLPLSVKNPIGYAALKCAHIDHKKSKNNQDEKKGAPQEEEGGRERTQRLPFTSSHSSLPFIARETQEQGGENMRQQNKIVYDEKGGKF